MARTPFGPLVRLLHRTAGEEQARASSDAELLRQFHVSRSEEAFQALVARHGPMVLSVCRAVLRNEADAEDAFQATFLVLAHQAGSIRKTTSLGCWLHGVAYRTALKARRSFARQRKHEASGAQPEVATPEDPSWSEVQRVVHEELNRLAPRYRAPLVLCYLQGETQDEAARLLNLPKGTLKGRLERGRALLRTRLVRRGLGPAALLTAAAWPAAKASAATTAATVLAAVLLSSGKPGIPVVSARVADLTRGVLRAMFLTKLKMVTAALVLLGSACALAVFAAGQAPEPPPTTKVVVKVEEPAKGAKVQKTALTPDELAQHLGISHLSFELTFDEAPAHLSYTIDLYENGKRVNPAPVDAGPIRSLDNSRKHPCTVLYSHSAADQRLELTVITPMVTLKAQMNDPFGAPGQIVNTTPKMDARGRIILALRPGRGDGRLHDVSEVTLENAEKALVLQVQAK